MKTLTALALLSLLALACSNAGKAIDGSKLGSEVRAVHDDERHVTCWIVITGYGAGISCLPDSQLKGEEQ